MAGGIMNLVSEGQGNILLNGNPTKTFFTTKFAKYSNFGLQKFRIDFEGSKSLRVSEESTFDFKILRYADLLMDTYLSVTLPNIWSPISPPETSSDSWIPYEFQWIENIGYKMISKLTINCGNQLLYQCSGDYLLAMIQRDFNTNKKELINKMAGNITELYDPANYGQNKGNYPNAYFTNSSVTPQPSIQGKVLYIPINVWFILNSEMAFPLTSLQYNELHIQVTLRPICQLYTIRDVFNKVQSYPRVAPNFTLYYMQIHRFLQPPPDTTLGFSSYSNQEKNTWDTNINLNCTYGFLSANEQELFALRPQTYLIKQVRETIFNNVTGSKKVNLESLGMISSWMFYFQRSDVNLRNEWSNYSNFPYNQKVPNYIYPGPYTGSEPFFYLNTTDVSYQGPGVNPDQTLTNLFITDTYSIKNTKEILINLAVLLDGEYRENIQPSGVYNYVEKYVRTPSGDTDGLYCYNFCLNTNVWITQPSGAINMSRFNYVQFEFNTIIPPLDLLAQSIDICDPSTGQVIGVNKPYWNIYDYNYDLHVFEERINFVIFTNGNCSVKWQN